MTVSKSNFSGPLTADGWSGGELILIHRIVLLQEGKHNFLENLSHIQFSLNIHVVSFRLPHDGIIKLNKSGKPLKM